MLKKSWGKTLVLTVVLILTTLTATATAKTTKNTITNTNNLNITLKNPKNNTTRHINHQWLKNNNTYQTRYSFNITNQTTLKNCTLQTNETNNTLQTQKTLTNPTQGHNKIFHNTTINTTTKWNIKCHDTNQTTETTENRTYNINIKPIPNITTTKKTWKKILFNATNSHDTDGNITKYKWELTPNNTTTTTEPTITHEYNPTPDYSSHGIGAVVRIIDNEGGQTSQPIAIATTRPLNESSDAITWRRQLDIKRRIEPDLGSDGEKIYVGTRIDSNLIHALNKTNGETIWNKSAPTNLPDGVNGNPLIEEGVLYQSTSDGILFALNLTNQKYLWNTTLSKGKTRPTINGDNLYIETASRTAPKFYKINKTNGEKLKTRKGIRGYSEAVVENGIVYVGGRRSKIHALNATTLETIWNGKTDYNWIDAKPIVLNNTIIACADGVYAFNKTNGKKLWKYKTGSILGNPTITNNTLYIGTKGNPTQNGGKLHAINMTTHKQIWNYTEENTGNHNWILSTPKIKNQLIYITNGQGKLQAINQNSGKNLWEHPLDGWTQQTPIINKNKLYISTTQGGLIYAFNTTKIEQKVDLTPPTINITAPKDGTKFNTTNTIKTNYTINDENPDYAEIKINNSEWQKNTANETTGNGTHTITLADGTYTIHAKPTDKAGNTGPEKNITITVNTQAPDINITSPTNNYKTNETWIEIKYNSTANDIQHYQTKKDTTTWENTTNKTHNFTQLNNGNHTLYARACDTEGKCGDTYKKGGRILIDNITVSINAPTPTITIDHPKNQWYRNVTNFTFTPTDDNSNTTYCQYQVNNGNWTEIGTINTNTSNTTQLTNPIDYTPPEEHEIHIACNNTNGWGNRTRKFQIDETPPQFQNIQFSEGYKNNTTWILPDPQHSPQLNITAKTTDPQTGIKSCEYTVDNESTWNNTNYTNGNCTATNITINPTGTIKLKATNDIPTQPQTNTTKPYNYEKDSSTINVTIIDPENGSTYSSADPNWNSTDSLAGGECNKSRNDPDLAYYLVKRDNGSWANNSDFPCLQPYPVSLRDGNHTTKVKAVDKAGNIGDKAWVYFIENSVGPNITILDANYTQNFIENGGYGNWNYENDTNPNDNYYYDDNITVTFTNDSAMAQVDYAYDESNWQSINISNLTSTENNSKWILTFTNIPETNQTLHIKAQDDNDNSGEEDNTSAYINSTYTWLWHGVYAPDTITTGTTFHIISEVGNLNEEDLEPDTVRTNLTMWAKGWKDYPWTELVTPDDLPAYFWNISAGNYDDYTWDIWDQNSGTTYKWNLNMTYRPPEILGATDNRQQKKYGEIYTTDLTATEAKQQCYNNKLTTKTSTKGPCKHMPKRGTCYKRLNNGTFTKTNKIVFPCYKKHTTKTKNKKQIPLTNPVKPPQKHTETEENTETNTKTSTKSNSTSTSSTSTTTTSSTSTSGTSTSSSTSRTPTNTNPNKTTSEEAQKQTNHKPKQNKTTTQEKTQENKQTTKQTEKPKTKQKTIQKLQQIKQKQEKQKASITGKTTQKQKTNTPTILLTTLTILLATLYTITRKKL